MENAKEIWRLSWVCLGEEVGFKFPSEEAINVNQGQIYFWYYKNYYKKEDMEHNFWESHCEEACKQVRLF